MKFNRCNCKACKKKTITFNLQICAIESTIKEHTPNSGLIESEIALEKYYKEFIDLFKEDLIKLTLLKH